LFSIAVCLLVALGAFHTFRAFVNRGPFGASATALERRNDWEAFGGTWQFVDGVVSNNSNERGAKLMYGSRTWTDYVVEADVLLLGEYGFAGLTVRATDEEEGVDAYHGYTAGVSSFDNALFLMIIP
jgi:hypothetical protein